MRGGSLTRYTPLQVGDGLWKTLLEIRAPAVAEGLQSLAQDKALDAAAGTVLRAGVSWLKRKANQSVRSTMQKKKKAKRAKNSIKSKVRQTTNHVRDVLGV